MERLTVTVIGRVQGVGFRMFVQATARRLGLNGIVRNAWNDSRRVELTAEGERTQLEQLLAAVQRGPAGSKVEDVQVSWDKASGSFQSFQIGYDY